MTNTGAPEGHPAVSPYLTVASASRLIDFLVIAFDGRELMRHAEPDGRISHAEVRIGDSIVMIGELSEQGAPIGASLHLYVPDVDDSYRRAVDAGAASITPPRDQPYGDRKAAVLDPAGNTWWIGSHLRPKT